MGSNMSLIAGIPTPRLLLLQNQNNGNRAGAAPRPAGVMKDRLISNCALFYRVESRYECNTWLRNENKGTGFALKYPASSQSSSSFFSSACAHKECDCLPEVGPGRPEKIRKRRLRRSSGNFRPDRIQAGRGLNLSPGKKRKTD